MAASEDIKTTKFQSPVPLLIRVRNLIFGKKKPDIYTRITFYLNLLIWVGFMLWSIISYIAISSRKLIFEIKGIPVESIIQERGHALGFTEDTFISRLTTFHAISVICWIVVLFGLILLYRKQRRFVYFILGGTTFYVGMIIFYISFQYFREDVTFIDKVGLLVLFLSVLLHGFLMKNERSGGSISFFGEVEDDE